MTIKTQRLVVRKTKITKIGEIIEVQKLYPMALEAYPLNQ